MRRIYLHDKLRNLRKAKGLTQDDVAEYLGVVRQTYSNYETGVRIPDSETIYKLASLFEVSTDELLTLITDIDYDEYYELRRPASHTNELSDYIEYLNAPENAKRLRSLSSDEKELIYYFDKLSSVDQKELIEIAKLKSRKA